MFIAIKISPLRMINVQYLQAIISFKPKITDKTCNFVSLYRSPNQSQDELEMLSENLELDSENFVQSNPLLIVVLGDF